MEGVPVFHPFDNLESLERRSNFELAPEPDYSEEGVDLSLIRWMLSLTPSERLDLVEGHVNDILAIRALNASHAV